MSKRRLPAFERLADAPEWLRNYYRLKLEIELRSNSGHAFQKLFDRIMRAIYGSDYSESVALGRLGDAGCDGIITSKRILFACYSPDPYFRIGRAEEKMRTDFARMLECWDAKTDVAAWLFVVNYPGIHPSLHQTARELMQIGGAPPVGIRSRLDLVELFMLECRRPSLFLEFGDPPSQAKNTPTVYIVPEDTRLPKTHAESFVRLIRSRLCCDKQQYKILGNKWCDSIARDVWRWTITQTHILSATMEAVQNEAEIDVLHLPTSEIIREGEFSAAGWNDGGLNAWQIGLALTFEVDRPDDPIGVDVERAIDFILSTEKIVLGLIRLYARRTGIIETECLDRVWYYITNIKLVPE